MGSDLTDLSFLMQWLSSMMTRLNFFFMSSLLFLLKHRPVNSSSNGNNNIDKSNSNSHRETTKKWQQQHQSLPKQLRTTKILTDLKKEGWKECKREKGRMFFFQKILGGFFKRKEFELLNGGPEEAFSKRHGKSLSKDLYICIFAFGVYNSKQVNVSGIQHYLAQM